MELKAYRPYLKPSGLYLSIHVVLFILTPMGKYQPSLSLFEGVLVLISLCILWLAFYSPFVLPRLDRGERPYAIPIAVAVAFGGWTVGQVSFSTGTTQEFILAGKLFGDSLVPAVGAAYFGSSPEEVFTYISGSTVTDE